jgi:prevent-host-death family protein
MSMVSVNIRELTHNFSNYLKEVKAGKRIIVMERNTPIADIIPHNENIVYPGWKRRIAKIELKGESFSETIVRNRREEKH